MGHRITRHLAVIVLATAAMPVLAIHKCRAPDGSLTYQEVPCPGNYEALEARLPTQFPQPDVAESERTLQREAALDRRLEAQRDRLSAEAIARISRVDAAPVPAEPTGTAWWPAWPLVRPATHRPHRAPRNAMREWSRGQLR